MLTQADHENYGSEFVDFSRRAALEALGPEVRALQQENRNLRAFAQRTQHGEIQRALDAQVPNWAEVYQNPRFSSWLSEVDPYSGSVRSQLMRNAVASGDSHRVVSFYKGFLAQHGATARGSSPRRTAPSGTIYTRPQIAKLYEQRRLGQIKDAQWGPLEADIVKAGAEGRVVGAIGPDGTELSRWAR
jgi:hypothetical protein